MVEAQVGDSVSPIRRCADRDPLVLVVWFLLHIGKDLFLELSCLLWYPKPYEFISVTQLAIDHKS